MASPLFISRKVLTLAGALKVVSAAEEFAASKGWSVVVAVSDDGGNLLCLHRMDGALLGSVAVAQEKARTSIIFKTPTKVFESAVAGGLTSFLKLEVLPFDGGVPIEVDGSIVGAVGVSGCAKSEYDGEVARAGAAVLPNAPRTD